MMQFKLRSITYYKIMEKKNLYIYTYILYQYTCIKCILNSHSDKVITHEYYLHFQGRSIHGNGIT